MTSSVAAVRSMDELGPAERVLTAGRPDRVQRLDLIALSTPEVNGPAHEAALRQLCNLFEVLHSKTVAYLRKGGTPGKQTRSGSVRGADDAYNGGLQVLAAAFAQLYPAAGEDPPIAEVEALVRQRVGPLCSGWRDDHNLLVHHPQLPCDIHDEVPGP